MVPTSGLRRRLCCAGWLFIIIAVADPARAQSPAPDAPAVRPSQDVTPQALRDELERLRKEFEAVRDDYGARLAALEARLAAMAGQAPGQTTAPAAPATQAPVPVEAGVPAGATGAGGPTGTLPVYGSTSALSKIFNPDIAVIGNFLGAAGDNAVRCVVIASPEKVWLPYGPS